MASTIIRIKRRLDDDAVDSLIVNTKRRKIDPTASGNTASSTIFNFVGTGKNPEDVLELIKRPLPQNQITLQPKIDAANVLKKLKNEWQENSKSDRFKVVNSYRFSKYMDQTSSTDSSCTIVEVESKKEDISDSPTRSGLFVYDYYKTNEHYDFDDMYDDALENVLSVCPLNKEIYCYRDQNDSDCYESDDSNAENYFTNDYPDESEKSDEENESCDEDDDDDDEFIQFRRRFRKTKLEESSDSDSEEYSIDLTKYECDEYDYSCSP